MHSSIRRFVLAAVGFTAAVIVLILIVRSSTTAQPIYAEWSLPAPLATVNTAFGEFGPHLSRDRKSLYFYSVRPGIGSSDIWVTEREDVETESWGSPQLVPNVNTTTAELSPSLSRDGHWLFFTRVNPGIGAGGRDIWVSYRQNVHDNLAWQPAINAGPGINTTADEADPSFFENEDGGAPQLFFNRGNDLFVSSMLPDGTWGMAEAVSELNTANVERGFSIRFDGLEAFFYSNRPGGGPNNDLWTTTRQSPLDPWLTPTKMPLVLVNSTAIEGEPDISSDRETLYFNSNRSGNMDLWVTHRTKEKL
jgi:Tol biopolymer transport system component